MRDKVSRQWRRINRSLVDTEDSFTFLFHFKKIRDIRSYKFNEIKTTECRLYFPQKFIISTETLYILRFLDI